MIDAATVLSPGSMSGSEFGVGVADHPTGHARQQRDGHDDGEDVEWVLPPWQHDHVVVEIDRFGADRFGVNGFGGEGRDERLVGHPSSVPALTRRRTP
jgi:hypothetical protein